MTEKFKPPACRFTKEEHEERWKCKTDLFYLAKEVLGYDLVNERTHRQVTDFFVQKDPSKPFDQQDAIKNRLLLFPRYGLKSTLNIADVVQWIIGFLDISILVLTPGSTKAQSLSEAFVAEAVKHFTYTEGDKKTPFQERFRDYLISPDDVKVGTFISPKRKTWRRDPTLWSSTIDSSLSGWHPDIIKSDDAVDNRNSQNIETLQKVTRNLHINRKMLNPKGYYELIGTRYNPFDAYGDALSKAGAIGADGISANGKWKVMHRCAMWLKDDPEKRVTAEDVKTRKQEDWILLFPEVLSYQKLIDEFHSDEQSFFSQYMNDPVGAGASILTLDDMRKATIPMDQVPSLGDIKITWDLAYSTQKGRDYTAGIVARHSEGRIVVMDAVRGRFTPKELAFTIVSTSQRWGVPGCAIEDSVGARFIHPELERVATALNMEFYVEWIEIESSKDAKAKRFEALQPLLMDGRLQIVCTCPYLEVIYNEFCNFTSVVHKDMADACGRQLRYSPIYAVQPTKQTIDTWEDKKRREFADLMYGQGRYAPKEQERRVPNPYALEPILGDLFG